MVDIFHPATHGGWYMVFERMWNRSFSIHQVSPSVSLSSFPSRCTRHVTHRSGFELCFPCATERRRARRPSSGDARNSWAQEGVLYSKQGGPLGPFHLSPCRPFCVVVSRCCCCVLRWDSIARPRPEPTSQPASPPDPSAEDKSFSWR